jgi:hypothetical protein
MRVNANSSPTVKQEPHSSEQNSTAESEVLRMLRNRDLDFSEEQIQLIERAVLTLPAIRNEVVDTFWVAETTGKSPWTIRNLARRGKIPVAGQNVPGRQRSDLRFNKEAILLWIAGHNNEKPVPRKGIGLFLSGDF